MPNLNAASQAQKTRNQKLLADTPFVGESFTSNVLPFRVDLTAGDLSKSQIDALVGLEKRAARIAIESLVSLAKVNDIDHLGGGLELIPALMMTLGICDRQAKQYTIEHAHTSIGYYSSLAALGYLEPDRVINTFRRGLDIAGHVSWVPGGTELNGGRLGVMVPVVVGQSLGLRARHGDSATVYCHCGDAGWISGQALNGFISASLHKAPAVFIMHRNGIQLSGTTAKVMNKDPRPIIASLGIKILEIDSLHNHQSLFDAYRTATKDAQAGQPTLIYPIGKKSDGKEKVTLRWFGEKYNVLETVEHFASKHQTSLDTEIWVPGSLMSFRDAHAMTECVLLVNQLPGGEGHHDGGMKGRDGAEVLKQPIITLTKDEEAAINSLGKPISVTSTARPAVGTKNLVLTSQEKMEAKLPGTDKPISPRAGSEAAYVAIAKKYPKDCFLVSCDLDPSTKLGAAAKLVPASNKFELSIQEQVACLIANGLACSSRQPQLNVVATFAAFFEGIAREGMELWRYQRNLTGANEGLNVVMHLSHVGACTGRDHFSGWSLDWINLAIGYLPFLRRFYAPSDARSAYLSVLDAAEGYGAHIVAIPRDNIPVLTKQDSNEPLWNAGDAWTPTTQALKYAGAKKVILAMGAPAYLAVNAAKSASKTPTDVIIVNGLPLEDGFLAKLATTYEHVITIEDGLIGDEQSGLRGLAGLVASSLANSKLKTDHVGICNPQVAPSDTFQEVWSHFGMTEDHLKELIG